MTFDRRMAPHLNFFYMENITSNHSYTLITLFLFIDYKLCRCKLFTNV
jgi:hypothetical protein